MKKSQIILAVAFCLSLADPALALDMEYYTYGGFSAGHRAFNRIALIFSDASYQGLIFVVTVLGLVAGVSACLMRAATGARIIPLVWAVPILIGAVVYLGVFVPKGNITVYDPILNRFQTIGGVPDAIVFTAGFLNKVEKGMVDIIDTAAVPEAAIPGQRRRHRLQGPGVRQGSCPQGCPCQGQHDPVHQGLRDLRINTPRHNPDPR